MTTCAKSRVAVAAVLAGLSGWLSTSTTYGALKHYWPFDATPEDVVGSADGRIVGAGVSITTGAGNFVRGKGALQIDSNAGAMGYVDIARPCIQPGQKAVSVSAWYRYEDIGGDGSDRRRYVWSTVPDYSCEFSIGGEDDGEWYFRTIRGHAYYDKAGPEVTDGRWHHVVLVWDRTTSEARYYHDGVLRDVQATTACNHDLSVSTGFHIGDFRDGNGGRNFDGYIDDVAVFDRVLTDNEVENIFYGATVHDPGRVPDSLPEAARRGRAVSALRRALPALSRYTGSDGVGLSVLRERLDGMHNPVPLRERIRGAEEQVLSLVEVYHAGREPAPGVVAGLGTDLAQLSRDLESHYGWPFFRGGVQGRATASTSVAASPVRRWVHRPPLPPVPAWHAPAAVNWSADSGPLKPTLTFDRVYHTTLQNGRLYYGSSADDAVHCLDAETGEEQWVFHTEGPVRLAPALYGGNAYVGSDDGCLYCLNATDGALRWKYRAGDTDMRLPGNGRMISMWPVRCGVVVGDGRVYFTAGLFPRQGVYLCALDALSGAVVWKHSIDSSPQGYMSLSPERIFLPTGRTPFATFDRATGKSTGALGKSASWGRNLKGGSYAFVLGNEVATGPSEDGHIHLFRSRTREIVLRSAGKQIIEAGAQVYVLRTHSLVAKSREQYRAGKQQGESWKAECPDAETMVVAGDAVVVGQKGQVSAFDRRTGRLLWQHAVAGRAEGLSVYAESLYVSTDRGDIYCFGEDPVSTTGAATSAVDVAAVEMPAADGVERGVADMLVERSGFRQGYALVLDAGDGSLCAALAAASDLRIIGVERDAAKVSAARKRLRAAHLYGDRVVIHHITDARLPYRHYLFNLVTSGDWEAGATLSHDAAELHRVLRPCGGLLALPVHSGGEGSTSLAAYGRMLPGWKVAEHGRLLLGTARRGVLAGAGAWTHYFGTPGNSACSGDDLPFTPMQTQWFGRPGPRYMSDRHLKAAPPLYANGHAFVGGQDYVAGLDAYNGTVLWERFIKGSGRVSVSRDCGPMAATDDRLYVAHGGSCSALAARTGETVLAMKLDDGKDWGYLAVVGDTVVGSEMESGSSFDAVHAAASRKNHLALYHRVSFKGEGPFICSRHLFARRTQDARERWRFTSSGVIINPAIACSGGKVIFVESTDPAAGDLGTRIEPGRLLGNGQTRVVALDVETGNVVWQTPVDLRKAQWSLYLLANDSRVVVSSSRHAEIEGRKRNRYDMQAFDLASGRPVWHSTDRPSHDHELESGHGELNQHPAMVGNVIYNTGFARYLDSGKPYPGWKWTKSGKCGVVSMSGQVAFSRYEGGLYPVMFDLETGKRSALTTVSRPGCWINTLGVGGMVLIPEASSGCTCGYSIQTSIALSPRETSLNR